MRAQEAHELVAALPGRHRGDGRGAGPGLRQSERELLRLLLRLTRDDAGVVPWPRATKWLAGQTGYSTDAIKWARRRLVELELVEVLHRGSGLDNGSLYRVAVERIRPVDEVQDHLLPAAVPVHPDEKAVLAEAVGGAPFTPGEGTVHPPRGNGSPPYARARVLSGFTGSTKTPPNPPPASPAGGTTSTSSTCTHGRAACRACGTTPRQQAKAARAAASLATANELKAQQEAARREREANEAARLADAADGRSKGYQDLIDHLAELGVAGFGVSKNQSDREEAS